MQNAMCMDFVRLISTCVSWFGWFEAKLVAREMGMKIHNAHCHIMYIFIHSLIDC